MKDAIHTLPRKPDFLGVAMKKCPYCSREVQNDSVKCANCGRTLKPVAGDRKDATGSSTNEGGIWSRYWGYIVSIPIIIICVANIIASIAGFSIRDEISQLDTNQPKYDSYAKPASVTDRPATEQYVKQREDLLSMSDEEFKKAVDGNPELAKEGVGYEIRDGKMVRVIPSAQYLEVAHNYRPPVNDEVYSTPDKVENAGNKKRQEEMHRRQIQQQKEIYK